MSAIPSFPQLSPDARPWRIDWFGELAYPGAVRRYTQPSIRVAISPLKVAAAEVPEADFSQQQNVWMPVGSLGMLRIGDVWQDGALVSEPTHCVHTFENLEIAHGSVIPIKAGLALDENYLLPFSEYAGHKLHTHSYCLMVMAPGNVRLIIPGIEMIRFYFGSCSILVHRLFTEKLRDERLWRERHFNTETRHLHLKLADGIPMYAVSDIARIATNSHARQAAASSYGHCVKATALGEPAYTYMGFPFQGKTSLKVAGMWLSHAGQPNQTFLAFHLLSCSHPFNFDSVTYDPCESAAWKRKSDANDGMAGDQNANARRKQKTDSTLDDADPGKQKAPRRVGFQGSLRFPDLRYKSVRLRELVVADAKHVFMKHADGDFELVSFGQQEGAGKARSIDACLEGPEAEIASPDLKLPKFVVLGLASAMSDADRRKGLVALPLVLHGETAAEFPLPMIVDEDGVVDTTLIFIEADGKQRMRRACFMGVFDSGQKIRNLAIFEGAGVSAMPHVKAVSGTDMAQLVVLI